MIVSLKVGWKVIFIFISFEMQSYEREHSELKKSFKPFHFLS